MKATVNTYLQDQGVLVHIMANPLYAEPIDGLIHLQEPFIDQLARET